MANDLKIRIIGTLNTGASIGEINTALKGIEKKLNKLKINVQIDDKAISTLNNFVKQAQKIASSGLVVDSNGMKKGFSDIGNSSKQAKNQQLNDIRDVQKGMERLTKQVDIYNKKREKIGTIKSFSDPQGITSRAVRLNRDGVEQGSRVTYNPERMRKQIEQQQKEEQKLADQIASKREQSIRKRIIDEKNLAESQAKAINKNAELDRKANEQMVQNVTKAKTQAQKQLQDLARTGKYTTEQLRKIGQGISLASTVKQIDQMKLKMNNLKFGDSMKKEQDLLRESLKKLYDQGKVNEAFFKNFNKVINGSNNVKEIQKVEQALKRVSSTTNNKNLQQKLISDANNLLRTHSKTVDAKGVKDLVKALQQVKPSASSGTNQLKQMEAQLNRFKDASKEAARSSMTMLTAFKTAMVKYPIWLAATSIFIGIPRLVTNAIQTIVELDSKLVSLQKVMSDDTNFTKLMRSANDSAKEFGKTLSETLDTYTEFSRQGYDEKEIPLLADAALVTSNVGEMEAGKSAEYLTSALVQMKLEAKDAMSVIDSWNSVSNQNATTVEKLAQGYARAASVARTWNLDMHELNAVIGTVTAATKQSGNEVGNFVKNALPRLTSAPAQEALGMVGVSLTDDQGNLKSALQIYKEVAKEYVKLDQINQSIVAEGLAGKYHISRMSALLSNMEMVDKMYEDSKNSSNSARVENDKYMLSVEARIKKTKQSFEELALATGEAFLTESFIGFLEAMKAMAAIGSKVTGSIGALPVIFGSVAVAALLMSKSFRTAITDMSVMRAGAVGLGNSFRGLAFSMKALAASTGVGILFVGLGMGIEYLLSRMTKAREESEAFERKNKELMYSFKENKDSVMNLATEYEKYDKVLKSGGELNTDDLEKYREISNELASLLPSLVLGEDQYGNKILASSEFIKSKTEQLEKQLAIQEKLDARENKKQAEDDYKIAKENLQKYAKEQENVVNNLNKLLSSSGISKYDMFKDIDDIKKKVDELNTKKSNGDLSRQDGLLLGALSNTVEEYDKIKLSSEDAKIALKNSHSEMINAIVATDEQMSASSKSMVKEFSMFVATSDTGVKKVDKILGSIGTNLEGNQEFKSILDSYGEAIDDYRKNIERGISGDRLEESKEKAKSAFNEVKTALLDMAKKENVDNGTFNKLSNQLDITANSALNLDSALGVVAKSTGKTKEELMAALALAPQAIDGMDGIGTSMDEWSSKLDDVKDDFASLSKIIQEMASEGKVTEATISAQTDAYKALADEVSPLNELLEKAAEGKQISAAEAMELIAQEKELANAISIENGVVKINEKAVKSLRDVKVKSYTDMLESIKTEAILTANKTIQNLKNYGIEIAAIKNLADAKAKLAQAETSNDDFYNNLGRGDTDGKYNSGVGILTSVTEQLENIERLQEMASVGLGQVGTESEKMSDSTKDSYESATYVSDKFKQALELINFALEKQQKIQAQFPKHSKQYQSALKNEIALHEQKRKLLEDQAKALELQIKSGKIQQTGIITSKSNSPVPTTAATSGGSNASQIWNFFKSKGFTDNIVAGIMGNLQLESGLNPNALNKSSGAFGIAQWLGERKSGLQNYAKSVGTSINDLNTQLNFLWNELNSTEKKTLNYLNSNQGASAANIAAAFDKLFERSEGTHIPQRQQNAQGFLGQFAGTGTTATAANVSKEVAENLQSVDEAKSELLQLQQDILASSEEMQKLQLELIKTPLYQAENRFRQIDSQTKIYDAQMAVQDEFSKEYRVNLQNQIILLKEKKKLTEQNMVYIEKELKTNKALTQLQRDELQQTYLDLRDSLVDIDSGIVDFVNSHLNSSLDSLNKRFDDTFKKINDELELIEHNMQMLDESDERQLTLMDLKVDNLNKQRAEIENNIKLLQSQTKNLQNNHVALEKNTQEIEKWEDSLREVDLQIVQTQKDLQSKMASIFQEQRDAYFDGIKKDYDTQRKYLEKQIEDAEDYYEPLIKAKEEQLRLLDEEYEKEDRLKQLREINDDINKTKNDKRFSYINEQGEEILTYDKAKVSELEKQRDELLQQYQREDIKKAIQDDIDLLEKSKNDRLDILQEQLDSIQENYDLQVEQNEKLWDDLLKSAEEGTVNFDELMNGWYGNTLGTLAQFGIDTAIQVENIKSLFASLSDLKVPAVQIPNAGNTGSKGTTKTFASAAEERAYRANNPDDPYTVAKDTRHIEYLEEKGVGNWTAADKADYEKLIERQKKHEGGIVGNVKGGKLAQIFHKVFNLKPGESAVKSLVGELQIPPKNMANGMLNIQNAINSIIPRQTPIVTQSGDTITLNNVTIKTENASTFLPDLKRIISTRKS